MNFYLRNFCLYRFSVGEWVIFAYVYSKINRMNFFFWIHKIWFERRSIPMIKNTKFKKSYIFLNLQRFLTHTKWPRNLFKSLNRDGRFQYVIYIIYINILLNIGEWEVNFAWNTNFPLRSLEVDVDKINSMNFSIVLLFSIFTNFTDKNYWTRHN